MLHYACAGIWLWSRVSAGRAILPFDLVHPVIDYVFFVSCREYLLPLGVQVPEILIE